VEALGAVRELESDRHGNGGDRGAATQFVSTLLTVEPKVEAASMFRNTVEIDNGLGGHARS